MSRSALRTALVAALLFGGSGCAQAEDAYTFNIGGVSDYVFRGISQTWGRPAIQGGGDATWDNGFAAGFWASSISEKEYPGAADELDVYGSYGAAFATDWSWRVGVYAYLYPGGDLDESRPALESRSFNTVEANAAIGWKWLTLKYNRSIGDYFAIDTEQGFRGDSHGTSYLQLDAAIPLDDAWSLSLHAGHTHIPTDLSAPTSYGARDASYSDVGATLKYQITKQWAASAGVTHADNDKFYGHVASFRNPSDVKDLGGTRGFVLLQGTF